MTAVAAARPATARKASGLDLTLGLILFCTFIEFARPTIWTFNLPIIFSATLLVMWIAKPRKIWSKQSVCFLPWLALMVVHIPFAENWFFAFWTMFLIAVTFALCLPLMHFVNSLRRFEIVAMVFFGAGFYVSVWAIGHDGWGPLGADGGQDQNYTALAAIVVLPFSYFYIFITKNAMKKLLFAVMTAACILAVVVGFSRGGFVGLCVAGFYCWFRSPNKLLGLVAVGVFAGVVVAWAPAHYWEEMGTIGDSEDETADHRIELWKIAWRQYLAHPIAGVGQANFRWNVGRFQSADQWEKFDRSLHGSHFTHSLYFELISEMGTIGILLFGAICFYDAKDTRWIRRVRRRRRGDPEELRRAKYLAMALEGSMVGFLVTSVFISTLYAAYFWYLSAMIVALRNIVAGPPENGSGGKRRPRRRVPAPPPASVPASPPASAGEEAALARLTEHTVARAARARGPRRKS